MKDDACYLSDGPHAQIINTPEEVYQRADLIVKVKEPQLQEYGLMREGQVIFSSQGADTTSWPEIRNNPYWAGSVAYFPERYGEFLVPNIIRLINGEDTDDPILMEHVSINAGNIDDWYPE